jgi:ketosteroid isomerase-like protein
MEEREMKKWFISLAYAFVLLNPISALAEPATKPTTQHDDAAVKELESRYAKFVAAAHKGDMAAFRALRTEEANQAIPPDATGAQLKDMADMMAPDLSGYQFVQLETQGKQARMAYKKRSREGLSFQVLMFEKDAGGWKIGGNHSQDFVGQTPSEDKGLKQALGSPEVRFSGK